jgi:tRNA(Ile)-lysidine synthase
MSTRPKAASRRTDLTLPPFETKDLPAGARLGIAVSGGSDSVALLRLAHRLAASAGWALRVLHVEHGLRGTAAQEDSDFVRALSASLGVDYSVRSVDTALDSREHGIGLEEAGRLARYGWFRELLGARHPGKLDAIATGHTLDDQAETVLAKILRGAWTAGIAGIYPQVAARDLPGFSSHPENSSAGGAGTVVRPLLSARREQLRAWLRELGQPWREDATNEALLFTRNRIRHKALPVLREVNAQADEHLAQLSVLARDEELYWQGEVERILAGGQLSGGLLQGKPVRGGGRASSTLPGEHSLGFELERLRTMPVALRRRVLRATAQRLGAGLSFAETERVLALVDGAAGSSTRREQMSAELRVERTARELRFVSVPRQPQQADAGEITQFPFAIPGEIAGLGVRLRARLKADPGRVPDPLQEQPPAAMLRPPKPGDRVRLRYSSGAPKRVKEVLERMGIPAADRVAWPLVEWHGEICWLRGAVLEPTPTSALLEVEVVQNN